MAADGLTPPRPDPLAPPAGIAGEALDGLTKGVPPGAGPVALGEVGRRGWNVLRGDLPFPVATLHRGRLERNAAWMAAFARLNGVDLCPHGKTTMSPQLWALQLAHGAWGITVATAQQLAVARRFGVPRVVWANQPVGRVAVDAAFAALADTDLYVLADSGAVVAGLAEGAARRGTGGPALKVLVEVGAQGGRTGTRGTEAALAVARGVAGAPGLALAGVEGFEGVLPDPAAVDAFLGAMAAVVRACAAERLFGTEEVVLTAGGSAFFDRVVARLAAVGDLGRPARLVLRSGCTLTHDSLGYDASYRRILDAAAAGDGPALPPGGLEAALEVWTVVQSAPEPGLAILACGKRDVSFDAGLPVPLRLFRPGRDDEPRPAGPFLKVSALNDQHAYLRGPADALSPAVGDLVALGVGHPCTTFDRWGVLALVDDALGVVGAVRTFF